MKLHEITEGKMKRSDPIISGDVLNKTYIPQSGENKTYTSGTKLIPARSAVQKRLQKIADRAGVELQQVVDAWAAASKEVDKSHPAAWGIITRKTKAAVGLQEDNTFKNTDEGSLVYGWKSADELRDEEGPRYISRSYTKILELHGIFANTPRKGQGSVLMQMFLDSPEAKEAELIFLDPVPGLGTSFKDGRSEEQQVQDLVRFYKRWGFRHNPASATRRMWRVQVGTIPDHKLPE